MRGSKHWVVTSLVAFALIGAACGSASGTEQTASTDSTVIAATSPSTSVATTTESTAQSTSDPVEDPSTTSTAMASALTGVDDPGTFRDGAAALLDEASSFAYEDWELGPGITSQFVYSFRSQGVRAAFIERVLEDMEAQGLPVRHARVGSITYELIDWHPEHYYGMGYLDNLLVIIDGSTEDAVESALGVIDTEWCCGPP